jgi:uncharacterized protein (DUF2147 family)
MRCFRLAAPVLSLCAISAATEVVAGSDTRLSGTWFRSDGATRINIAPCGESLCAINTWVKDASEGERVGDRLVMTLQPRQPATLAGEALDVRRGLKYSLLISYDRDSMTTRGCLIAGLVCRTVNWVRAR